MKIPDNESQLVGNTSKYCMRAELCKSQLWAGSVHYVFICQGRGCLPAKCVGPERYANADECWQPVNCHSAHLPASWDSSGFFSPFFFFFAGLFFAARLLASRSSALMHTKNAQWGHEAPCSVLIKGKSSHALFSAAAAVTSRWVKESQTRRDSRR